MPLCTSDATNPLPAQPLLGWGGTDNLGNGVAAIDVKCAGQLNSQGQPMSQGADNLIVIANSVITSPALNLPTPTAAPCKNMAPARDEQNSFPSVYLLASIVPSSSGNPLNLSGCAPNVGNKQPYVIEYTANPTGVFGRNGSRAGSPGRNPAPTSHHACH